MSLKIIILAAGQGKRMHSDLPKVLHPLAGKPMLQWVIEAAEQLRPAAIHVIHGHGGECVRQQFAHAHVNWIEQSEQLGTGHAVAQALPYLDADDQVLVLYGDVPLISVLTLQRLHQSTPKQALGLLIATLAEPYGLGRILRNQQGEIIAIIEEKDATESQRSIKEIFSGILLVPAQKLHCWLPQLNAHNAQGEYYLTDIVKFAVAEKMPVTSVMTDYPQEIYGINSRVQLIALERHYQSRLAEQLMAQGVTIMDPLRFDVRGTLQVGKDVTIDNNVLFEGEVIIGSHCYIGPNCVVKNSVIGDHVEIKANTVVEQASIQANCSIGPFARVRPGTQLAEGVKIGNFVELKQAVVGSQSKINHLSYIGDAEIGREVNIGAGTITCNYDGVNKHLTRIEDHAFIGSNTALVAPVVIGKKAFIGAGSTITKAAPAGKLSLSRSKQLCIPDWQPPRPMNKEPEYNG